MPVSSRLELFEHDTLRVGQSRRGVDGSAVRITTQHVGALARFNDQNFRRFFSVGHECITTTSYVGYVEVGDLAIEILPKADRAGRRDQRAWRAGLLEMLRVVFGLRLATPTKAGQTVGRSSLIELVAGRFLDEVERLLHEGLARGYRRVEENGPAFRGRLLVRQNLRDNLVRADRFYVEHHVFDPDVTVNRILAMGLTALGELALSPGLWARARACRNAFPDVTEPRANRELFEAVRLGRSTVRYQDALVLARMLLEHRAPQLRSGTAPVFAILFDMNALWERYVTWLFRRACPARAAVTPQRSAPFFRPVRHAARVVRPDIVVRDNDRILLIADAKWKAPTAGPSIDDLKQMFVYNELLQANRAALVYPRCRGESSLSGPFVVARGHTCETVHLETFDASGWSSAAMIAQIAAILDPNSSSSDTAAKRSLQ